MSPRLTRFLPVPVAVLSVGALIALAGCASAEPAAETPAAAAPSGASAQDRGGVSGEIAWVGEGLIQVQDSDSQTAVAFDDATTITAEVAAALSDIAVGDCVTVIGSDDDSAATSIAVSEAADGECTSGFGGGPGGASGFPGGVPTDLPEGDRPEGAPSDGEFPGGAPTDGSFPGGTPTGGPQGGFGGAGAFTTGKVTAVADGVLTVESTDQDGTTSATEVAVDASTTVTATVDADASALVVGQCATAQGEADSSGEVAATTIRVSDPVDGSCTSGLGGGFGGGRAPGGQGPEGSSDSGSDS